MEVSDWHEAHEALLANWIDILPGVEAAVALLLWGRVVMVVLRRRVLIVHL